MTYLKRLRDATPWMFYGCIAHILLLILFLVLPFFDDRQLLGINLWAKPAKFASSIAIFFATMMVWLQTLPKTDRFITFFDKSLLLLLSGEMLIIGGQAGRGQASHFNNVDLLGSLLFALMGIMIVAATILIVWAGVRIYRNAAALKPPMRFAFAAATAIFFFSALIGGLMSRMGAHTIGGVDGSVGIPLFNWSFTLGDLRSAHFLGIHALQILPISAFLMRRLDEGKAKHVTMLIALVYAAFTVGLFLWAMTGTSPFYPLMAILSH